MRQLQITNCFTANNNINNKESFKGNLGSSLPALSKPVSWLISTQEQNSGLSHIRFIQDTTTNWIPKATLSRSKADFAEMSFLEFAESALFYYMPALLGEHVSRRFVFSKFLPENLRHHLAEPTVNLVKNQELKNSGALKKILPIKAAILLSCACIPAAEYALSFAKNLFTLKFFKTASFSSIANLHKKKAEDPEHQEKVRNSAHKNIKLAGIISAVGIGTSLILATFGHKSKALQSLSGHILSPGTKIANSLERAGLKSSGTRKRLEKYVNLDFANNNGKLCLSNGQLATSVIAGAIGYLAAAKDRGKLDYLETATRLAVVVPYTIFGSALLDGWYKKYLFKKNKYPELITKNPKDGSIHVPRLDEIPELAKKVASKNGTTVESEYKRLFRGKATVSMAPFLFSLLVVGFFVAAATRYWTKCRYACGVGREDESKQKKPAELTPGAKKFRDHLVRNSYIA